MVRAEVVFERNMFFTSVLNSVEQYSIHAFTDGLFVMFAVDVRFGSCKDRLMLVGLQCSLRVALSLCQQFVFERLNTALNVCHLFRGLSSLYSAASPSMNHLPSHG